MNKMSMQYDTAKLPLTYFDARSLDPVAQVMEEPWYRISDTSFCDPNLSNPTGRAFTSCPFGVQLDLKEIKQHANKNKPVQRIILQDSQYISVPLKELPTGSLYPSQQGSAQQVTPPQANPYPLTRVGFTFRAPWI